MRYVPYRLMYLNAWSPVDVTGEVLETLGGRALLEGVGQ